MRAAFVGADTRIADLATLAIHLRWPEVTPIAVTSAAEALDVISRESLDVVVLHPELGDCPLVEFIQDMRGLTKVPVLVLSDQGDETEVVTALEAGADAPTCYLLEKEPPRDSFRTRQVPFPVGCGRHNIGTRLALVWNRRLG